MTSSTRRVTLALSALALLTGLVAGCGFKNVYRPPSEYQREAAASLAPAALEAPARGRVPAEQRRVVRVRAWADAAYRAQKVDWKQTIERQVARASEFLGPRYGITLRLDEVRPWDHQGSNLLETALTELEAHDAGGGADLVLGFVSSLATFSRNHHELGMARILGRHAVLRGMENPEEARAIEQGLDLLSVDERSRLMRERRLHKETAILLHECGHLLGAVHVAERTALMAPFYDAQQSTFGTLDEVVALGARHAPAGLSAGPDRDSWLAELRALAGSARAAAWDRAEREQLVAELSAGGTAGASAPKAPRRIPPTQLTRAEQERLARAGTHLQAGRFAEARSELGDLPARYPGEFSVQLAACDLAVRQTPQDVPGQAACKQASFMQFGDPWPWLLLAYAHSARGEEAAALESTRNARSRLLDDGSAAPPQAWAMMADVAARQRLVTWTEEALARAGQPNTALGAWAANARRMGALGSAAAEKRGVAPEREAAYLRLVDEALRALDGPPRGAQAKLSALRKGFPDAPGTAMVACGVAIQGSRLREARTLCQRTLAEVPEALPALHLMGIIEQTEGKAAAAIRYLERTVELDPGTQGRWQDLATLYRANGHTDRLNDLRKRYRERFRADLSL